MWGVRAIQVFAPLGIYCLTTMMGVYLFGGEFADHTMERLLVQPIPRCQIWREKLRSLAMMLALGLLPILIIAGEMASLAYGKIAANVMSYKIYNDLEVLQLALALIMLGLLQAMIIGPFMALFLRQLHTAFWATLLVPAFLSFFWMLILQRTSLMIRDPGEIVSFHMFGRAEETFFAFVGLAVILAIHTAVYFTARSKFLRLEV
jgi:ABC-type transport system involved in multi-copper enzyme maturation permease subunit